MTRALAGTLVVFGLTTAPKWTAILQPRGDTVMSGSAVVEPVSQDSTRASIQLAGARPGTALAWQIQSGGCETDGGQVLGERTDYPLLKVGPDGKTSGAVTLAAGMPGTGEFSVMVRKRNHPAGGAACGRLTATGRADNP
jgi:hypothetical protein